MFGDERAPAPLDRPLDLDRRWRGSPLGTPPPSEPPADGAAGAPPWWRCDAGSSGPQGPAVALAPPAAAGGPAEPEQLSLLDPDAVRGAPDAGRRLLAAGLDAVVVGAAAAVPVLFAVRAAPDGAVVACAAFVALLAFTYAALGHALMGATVGKRLLGLRVEGPDGGAPGIARSVARAALAVAGTAALGAGIVLGLMSRNGRALHDLVAGTSVVRAPALRR